MLKRRAPGTRDAGTLAKNFLVIGRRYIHTARQRRMCARALKILQAMADGKTIKEYGEEEQNRAVLTRYRAYRGYSTSFQALADAFRKGWLK